ncbi:hypothetical protein [Acinetobacter radioresistens]|uniref:hypothetical protein n=1 Tax=Acinetobacter radioresistens TaxID=40216 RepID=UPI0020043784|nr:hypothetical protein [Acinetobacter radioresistens]MCK4108907.1 hypothetical protein [Acinetobacter radioresistens]
MNTSNLQTTKTADKNSQRKEQARNALKAVGKIIVREVVHQLLQKFERKLKNK